MALKPVFHTRTALANGLRELFTQLETRLSLRKPLSVYLAGGMAVHLYTARRVTDDVDAEFGGRIAIPGDLVVEVMLEDGRSHGIYIDTNYNSTFALLHEDYQSDALPVDLGVEHMHVRVLAPVDLAVSKIARLADNDREDIRELVRLGLTTAEAIEERANSALGGFVGGEAMLRLNIRDAVAIARDARKVLDLAASDSTHAAEWRRRVDELPSLKNGGGAVYTFWRHATDALKATASPAQVNWAVVEQKTIQESIGQHGQAPESVAQVICAHSPGAASESQQAFILAEIQEKGPTLQRQYALSRCHDQVATPKTPSSTF
jgi:hypothetical protein